MNHSTSFRFIHAADIHLDSPMKGLFKMQGAVAEKIIFATRLALERLVTLAEKENVDFVLLAGDIFDQNTASITTSRFFIKQMSRLSEAGIPVYIIFGNHDAANAVFKENELPSGVFCYKSSSAESYEVAELPVVIHGQSYASHAVTSNLVLNYPSPVPYKFNIGLLHTSLEGKSSHCTYAPCDLQTLKMKGYEYWALGHVHKRQVVCQEPYIVYSGNTQGRHIYESGEKGCLLVDVIEGEVKEVTFYPLDTVRWQLISINISSLDTVDQVITIACKEIEKEKKKYEGLFVAVRLHLYGISSLHWKLLNCFFEFKESLEEFFGDNSDFWLEEVKLLTEPPTNHEYSEGLSDLIGALIQVSNEITYRKALSDECQEIVQAVSEKIRSEDSYLNEVAKGDFERLQKDAQSFIISRLMSRKSN